MNRLHSPTAVAALALCLALAAPALAQQAASPQAPAPQAADDEAGEGAAEAAPARGQRQVSGRELMSPEERRSFRRQMKEATPEEQMRLWQQKHAELEQRAAGRGMVLAEPNSRPGGMGRHERADEGRGEARGWMVILVTRQPPRAP